MLIVVPKEKLIVPQGLSAQTVMVVMQKGQPVYGQICLIKELIGSVVGRGSGTPYGTIDLVAPESLDVSFVCDCSIW